MHPATPISPTRAEAHADNVVAHFVSDFRCRFLRLLQGPFREQPTRLALSIVDPPADAAGVVASASDDTHKSTVECQSPLTAATLLQFLSRDDIHRLEQYGRNLVEYALVLDIVPSLAALFLSRRMSGVRLSHLQCAILVAVGCQHHTFDQVAAEFHAPASQLLALFNKAMHKLSNYCRQLLEQQAEEEEGMTDQGKLRSGQMAAGGSFVKETLKADQQAGARKTHKKLDAAREELLGSLTQDLAVAPAEEDLRDALGGRGQALKSGGTISVRRKRDADGDGDAAAVRTESDAPRGKRRR